MGSALERIKDLIEDQCGINRKKINSESRIEEDLYITGADAVDLIVAFSKIFKVDVSNFMAADYFQDEGMQWLLPNQNPRKKILKVSHLEKAIEVGRLDENTINE